MTPGSRPRRMLAPSRWSLRVRILSGMVALLAVLCLVVSAVTALALRRVLVGRLDEQVLASAGRAFDDPDGLRRPPDTPPPARAPLFLVGPGQAVGTVGALVVDGSVRTAGILDEDQGPARISSLSPDDTASLATVAPGADPVTRRVGDLGNYRVAARATPDGVIVSGLPLAAVDDTVSRLIVIEVIVSSLALLAAAGAGSAIVQASLAPLDRVAATATRVAALPLASGDVTLHERVPERDADPRTEVGQVALALNRMLGHVDAALAARQASETRVRRFVADASHELRTPLAAIRGYAEFAQTRGGQLSADTAHALARVRSQTERMGDLVDDLLLLARLDSGRPLAREPVDLSRLLVDAIGDARAAAPGHHWRLDLPAEPVEVVGDAGRLHQIAANVLSNARVHTPPGTTVTVGLRQSRGRADGATAAKPAVAVLTVVDDGPGVPESLRARVFERFTRGDDGRTRGAGSTGLGLAIVAAVAQAHGGRAELDTEPGRTTVTVTLPVAGSGGPPASTAAPA